MKHFCGTDNKTTAFVLPLSPSSLFPSSRASYTERVGFFVPFGISDSHQATGFPSPEIAAGRSTSATPTTAPGEGTKGLARQPGGSYPPTNSPGT